MELEKIFKDLKYNYVPASEINQRIKKFQNILLKNSIDVAIITSKVHNFYFTGTNQEQILFIFAEKDPILFVKRDNKRAQLESPLNIETFKGNNQLKNILSNYSQIGVEYNYLTAKEFLKFKDISHGNLCDITRLIYSLRKIKSNWEISIMKHAAKIAEKVYLEGMNYLKEGISEIEFGSILFSIAQKNGHEGILRTGSTHFEPVSWHILSGISGCIHGQYDAPASGLGMSPAFPNSASLKKIEKHEPIMVDFGISYLGYQVDTTRMFSIGEPEEKFLSIYDKSKKIENKILNLLKSDTVCSDIFNFSIQYAKELKIYENYLGIGEYKKKFVGHGVGLETSESPLIAYGFNEILEENMTVAIEPKIVIENFGIIGIENTYLVKYNCYEKITNFYDSILIV